MKNKEVVHLPETEECMWILHESKCKEEGECGCKKKILPCYCEVCRR